MENFFLRGAMTWLVRRMLCLSRNTVSATLSVTDKADLAVKRKIVLWTLGKLLSWQYIMCYAPGHHIIYTQPHTAQNDINQKPKLACNSEGTDELPQDGTQLLKHVGAAKVK
jgi:hypothetical protein